MKINELRKSIRWYFRDLQIQADENGNCITDYFDTETDQGYANMLLQEALKKLYLVKSPKSNRYIKHIKNLKQI